MTYVSNVRAGVVAQWTWRWNRDQPSATLQVPQRRSLAVGPGARRGKGGCRRVDAEDDQVGDGVHEVVQDVRRVVALRPGQRGKDADAEVRVEPNVSLVRRYAA